MKARGKKIVTAFMLAAIIAAAVFPSQASADVIGDKFGGTNGTNFIIPTNKASISVATADISSVQAVFAISLNPTTNGTQGDVPAVDPNNPNMLKGFQYSAGSDPVNGLPTGTIQGEADLGVWDTLFSNNLVPTPGEGLWLDFAPVSQNAATCLLANQYDSSCLTAKPLVSYLLRTDNGRMRILGTSIQFRVQVDGLQPGTLYQARLRIEDESDGGLATDTAVTPLIQFTTQAGTSTLAASATQNEANATTSIDPETGLPSCGVFGENSSIMGCVAQIVYSIVFKPTTWLMVLTGEIMDWGIGFSIDSASYPVSNHSFVTDGWRIMRDLANILFIFILVYVAITTIFGADNKKLIAMVILVAIIINFSLFLCKIIIDVGNITSRFFYNTISVKNTQTGADITGSDGKKSISYGFAAVFNPLKLFAGLTPQTSISTAGGVVQTGLEDANTYAQYFTLFSVIGAVVNLVAAYVFFSLAWLFIARTAGIWLAIIFSPIAFLSLALPDSWKSKLPGTTKKYASFGSWLGNLGELTIMPAIAMLMIFLILTFLQPPGFFASLATSTTTTGRFMSMLVPLIVISYLLLQTKKIAESMSGEFGDAMGKLGSFVGGAAIGVATGGAALAGRRVLGGLGTRIANSENLKKSALGRGAINIGRRMETATYDLKNTKAAQFGLNKAGYKPNEYFNTTVKSGYKDQKETQKKQRDEYLNSMKLSDKSKKDIIAGSASGRQETVASFRKQYKKAYNASGQNTPGSTPAYPFPQGTPQQTPAPTTSQPQPQPQNQPTQPSPYTSTSTANVPPTPPPPNPQGGSSPIIATTIIGGGNRPVSNINPQNITGVARQNTQQTSPLQNLKGVDDAKKSLGYSDRQSNVRRQPSMGTITRIAPNRAPSPTPLPKNPPLPPNSNGFSTPTIS